MGAAGCWGGHTGKGAHRQNWPPSPPHTGVSPGGSLGAGFTPTPLKGLPQSGSIQSPCVLHLLWPCPCSGSEGPQRRGE